MRHWNDKQIIYIEIHENSNYSEVLHTKGWNNLGMGRNSRIEGVYSTAKVSSSNGEFE